MSRRTDGIIDITFGRRNDRTIATSIYHRGNARVSASMGNKQEINIPYYFIITTGGGFIQGEHYTVDILIKDNAHSIVTTQTPTYIFKCDDGLVTTQNICFNLGENSCFEFYGDPVIPYHTSKYRQNTIVRMKKTSTLILTDGLTSGWSPDDKPFEFHDVSLKTRIYIDDKLVLNDFLICSPLTEDMERIGYFESHKCYNSITIIDESINDKTIKLMREFLESVNTDSVFGITKLEIDGLVMRIMGRNYHQNLNLMKKVIKFFREEIKGFDSMNLRKNDN